MIFFLLLLQFGVSPHILDLNEFGTASLTLINPSQEQVMYEIIPDIVADKSSGSIKPGDTESIEIFPDDRESILVRFGNGGDTLISEIEVPVRKQESPVVPMLEIVLACLCIVLSVVWVWRKKIINTTTPKKVYT